MDIIDTSRGYIYIYNQLDIISQFSPEYPGHWLTPQYRIESVPPPKKKNMMSHHYFETHPVITCMHYIMSTVQSVQLLVQYII